MYLHGVSGNETRYNTIVGNVFYQNGKTGSKDGIYISTYSQYNVVDGNTFYDNGNYGVREASSETNRNLIVGNVFFGNDTGTIRKYGVSSVVADNLP